MLRLLEAELYNAIALVPCEAHLSVVLSFSQSECSRLLKEGTLHRISQRILFFFSSIEESSIAQNFQYSRAF